MYAKSAPISYWGNYPRKKPTRYGASLTGFLLCRYLPPSRAGNKDVASWCAMAQVIVLRISVHKLARLLIVLEVADMNVVMEHNGTSLGY